MPGRTSPLWRETLDAHYEDAAPGESPFAGPLILVAISRVLAIPVSLYQMIKYVGVFLKPGVWTTLTSPLSHAYHRMWAPTILCEGTGKVGIFLCCIMLAWMFFARKKIFRPTIVTYSVILVVFQWGDHFLGGMIPAVRANAIHNNLIQLVGTTIGTLIWVPYYLVSERVKRVFVR